MKTNKIVIALISLVGIYFFMPAPQQLWEAPPRLSIPPTAELLKLAPTFLLKDPSFDVGSETLARLGRKLFFDPALSSSKTISCSTCHIPDMSFTDGKQVAEGIDITTRNTPTLINAHQLDWFFWDGRAHSLEHQALGPLENQKEHGFSRTGLAQVIIEKYRSAYERLFGPINLAAPIAALGWVSPPQQKLPSMSIELAAYGIGTLNSTGLQVQLISLAAKRKESPQEIFGKVAMGSLDAIGPAPSPLKKDVAEEIDKIAFNATKAIAAYERRIVSHKSPFDLFVERLKDQQLPVSAAFNQEFGEKEWHGFGIFVAAGCTNCHHSGIFSDQQFHNIGLSQTILDTGRAKGAIIVKSAYPDCNTMGAQTEACAEIPYLKTTALENMGAFKTPTLRNVSLTAPYMHDGRFANLDEVLDHYDNIKDKEPGIGHSSESLQSFQLTAEERESLKLFLNSLSSPVQEIW